MTSTLRLHAMLWASALAACLSAQDVSSDARGVDEAIEDLQRISQELNRALKVLETHLDDAIARYDSGYRVGRQQILGADAELTSGEANVRRAEVRKLMLARMLAVRGPGRNPAPLTDSDHLQDLILEARKRVEASDAVIRRLPLVSVRDLSRREEGEWKAKHDQLLKARTAAEEGARKALLALPVDLPEADSPEEAKDKAFELIVTGGVNLEKEKKVGSPSVLGTPPAAIRDVPSLPLRWHRNKLITLVREPSYLIALTDPGIEDEKGRHLFYQEEWVQSGVMVVKTMRWRVAVDTATGQHSLIKRYPPRKQRGEIGDVYSLRDQNHLWRLEPLEDSEPSRLEVESALSEVAHGREQLRGAIQDYRAAIRNAVSNNDRLQATENQAVPDAALAPELREKLFAIRGHLAGATAILDAEKKLGAVIDHLATSVGKLESLAAWANRPPLNEQEPLTKLSASEWETLQQRSEDEIDLAVRARAEARAVLPPDLSQSEAKFPALQQGLIVHIVRQSSARAASPLRCVQEVWRLALPGRGGRRVERHVTLIAIDSKTGIQRVLGAGTDYYSAGPDDALEGIFDQYEAQDVPLASIQP
jgi:hypothetical protein